MIKIPISESVGKQIIEIRKLDAYLDIEKFNEPKYVAILFADNTYRILEINRGWESIDDFIDDSSLEIKI